MAGESSLPRPRHRLPHYSHTPTGLLLPYAPAAGALGPPPFPMPLPAGCEELRFVERSSVCARRGG